eukprot:244783-Hanusia_phi.AAC.2
MSHTAIAKKRSEEEAKTVTGREQQEAQAQASRLYIARTTTTGVRSLAAAGRMRTDALAFLCP